MKTDKLTFGNNLSEPRIIPRPPFSSEKSALLSFILDTIDSTHFEIDEEEHMNARALIDSGYIAVYENYANESGSGFTGKLMSVVWTTGPADHEVFLWRNGVLEEVKKRLDDAD